ncbi:hypothetical protein [Halobacillus sp. BBL2006]|uniref:SecDF P1 head subdomain-containing protein n=1 Tax=Halobacillus sp. BBL2006 TaxID=1543706 RepID=UPI000542697A|nr:hypothetical protein [Halobacillus sp. BBL2006]KHE67044.1 hypothetical protein LD39_19590 [Halobacillus sp. BBL2006]
MKYIISLMLALLILTGCQQDQGSENANVSIKDQEGEVIVTESDFSSARLQDNQDQKVITLTYKDADKLKEMTENHFNEKVHVYLGEEKISSPRISQVIDSDSIQISGDYSDEQAKSFIDVINN